MYKMLIVHSLILVLVLSMSVLCQDVVNQEGEGLAGTEKDALIAAKRDAIEKAIGTMLISQTEVENFMLKKDIILTETIGSIKSYKEISNTKTADGLFSIKIAAVVSKAAISKDLASLKILLESMDKPRVMVLVKESNMGDTAARTKAAETEIIDILKAKQFNMVDPSVVAALIGSGDATIEAATKGDIAAAAKIGRDNGAEVILVGTAIATKGSKMEMLGPLNPAAASVNIRVITCATGKIIAAKQEEGRMADINVVNAGLKSIRKAAKKVMLGSRKKKEQSIFELIVGAWQKQLNDGMAIRVMIGGVNNFKTMKNIGPFLEAMSGNIVKATKRNWKKKQGTAEFEIQYKGSAEGFCTEVDEKALPDGRKLSVSDFTANSASVDIVQ